MRDGNFEQNLAERNKTELESFGLGYLRELRTRDFLSLNSMIVTCGLRSDSETMNKVKQRAFGKIKPGERTGNIGIGIYYGPGFRSQSPVQAFEKTDFSAVSPLQIEEKSEKFYVTSPFAGFSVPIDIVPAPVWYSETTKIGDKEYALNSLAQSELDVVMLAIPDGKYQQCAYDVEGKKCGFCALKREIKPMFPECLASIIRKDLEEGRKTSVTMTGGNTYRSDNGFAKYIPYINILRSEFGQELPIQIEASPPTDEDVQYLIDNKVSLMANLEVWDDDARRTVIPAKSAIPKLRYLDVFKRMRDAGGDVYSVLIRDLEPRESFLEGVEYIAKSGATTVVLPFKPNKGSPYENRMPCSAKELLESTIEATKIMRMYGLDLSKKSPYMCSGCGGCGVDANVARSWSGDYDNSKK